MLIFKYAKVCSLRLEAGSVYSLTASVRGWHYSAMVLTVSTRFFVEFGDSSYFLFFIILLATGGKKILL
jgi:hypothetical protein